MQGSTHCETDAGWQKFLAAQGFTIEELRERWKQRMEVLRFIEERFRMGIRISPDGDQELLREDDAAGVCEAEGAAPPKLETISDRIQEILLQQQVEQSAERLAEALRAQGTVRMLKPGRQRAAMTEEATARQGVREKRSVMAALAAASVALDGRDRCWLLVADPCWRAERGTRRRLTFSGAWARR